MNKMMNKVSHWKICAPVLVLTTAAIFTACRTPSSNRPAATSVEHRTPKARCPGAKVDYLRRQKIAPANLRWVERRMDLDGDGKNDLLLSSSGFCGSGGCQWHFYGLKRPCPRWLGSFFGRILELSKKRTNGYREMSLGHFAGSCNVQESRLQFNGIRYRAIAERNCRCVSVPSHLAVKPGINSHLNPPKGCTPWKTPR